MKIKLLKDVSIEVIGRYEELYSKGFSRGWIADVKELHENGSFSTLVLSNGETLIDIPKNSYTILK